MEGLHIDLGDVVGLFRRVMQDHVGHGRIVRATRGRCCPERH